MNAAFKLGRPEGFLGKMVPDRFKAHNPEADLQRWSGRLSDAGRQKIESALNEPSSPQQQVEVFTSTLEDLKGKEDPRSLYAATVLGVQNLEEKIDSPLLDVTNAAVGSSSYAVNSAVPYHLADLTDLAIDGLHTYSSKPETSPLHLAADFEDKVGYLADSMAPALTDACPRISEHAGIYTDALREMEIGNGDFLRNLDENPNAPLAKTLHTVLSNDLHYGADVQDVQDLLSYVGGYDSKPEISGLVDRSFETLSSKGLDSMMDMLKKESEHPSKAE